MTRCSPCSLILVLFAISLSPAIPEVHGQSAKRPRTCTNDICLGPDGAVIVTGTFSDSSTFGSAEAPKTSAGGSDAFVARYAADGSLEWLTSIGGGEHDEGCAIAATSDGGVIVTGLFRGTIDLDPGEGKILLEAKNDEPKQFLVRLSPAGAAIWAQSIAIRDSKIRGVDASRLPFDIAVDEKDAIYVAGTTASDDAKTSAFLLKLDLDGKTIWTTSFGEGESIQPHCLTVAGGVCLLGGRAVPPRDVHAPTEMLVMSFDRDGKEVWSRRWSGKWIQIGSFDGAPEVHGSTGTATAIATDGKGLIAVTGSIQGTIDFDAKKRSKSDTLVAEGTATQAFLLFLDAKGEYRGVVPVNPKSPGRITKKASGTVGSDVVIAPDGTITVVGTRRSFQKVQQRDLSLSHLFVSRYKRGRQAWSRFWDPKIPQVFSGGCGLAISSEGTVFATGYAPPSQKKGVFARQGEGLILSLSAKGKPTSLGE